MAYWTIRRIVYGVLFDKGNADILLKVFRTFMAHYLLLYLVVLLRLCWAWEVRRSFRGVLFYKFFRLVFNDKKLAPSTIAAYKPAVACPLRYAFGADVAKVFLFGFY